jgi:rSAM/selenodomain-associated transferase 2
MEISVIMPVYREECIINSALCALKSIACGAELEIIVVDGGPGALTLNSIEDAGVIKLVSAAGRARQMNAGAAKASGEVLLFLHADTKLPAGALADIERLLSDGTAKAGAFRLAIDTKNIFLKFIAFTANVRTKLFRMPYGDQALFFTRQYFNEIGGYKDIPLMEDVEIMRRARKRGDKIAVAGSVVLTSARRWKKEGVLRATLRNKSIKLLYNLGVRPEKLARYYTKEA